MNNSPILLSAQVTENIQMCPGFFRISIDSSKLAESIIPGQFFHIRITNHLDTILRRPFSVFNYNKTKISILYEIVGKGTKELSLKKAGDELDMLGPLGNGFSISDDINNAVLAGGGVGIAPLYILAKKLLDRGKTVKVLIGAKIKSNVLCENEFRNIGIIPEISTDDGSYGFNGLVTGLLKEQIADYNSQSAAIYACGPNAMLKEIAIISKKHNIPAQLSMDRHMACGLGVCLGCAIKTAGGAYKMVCKDGPVFNAEEPIWE